ncbi:MAG: hypothetical protein WC720_05120 [Candidatus Shapirobacteria bacterium]|jgi:hypothetical protein
MYRNRNFVAQTLTDAGVIYLNPQHALEDVFEGSIQFTATGTKATGTFAASCQLQGSNSVDFSTGVVNLGSAVVLSDTVLGSIPLSGNSLNFAYYRVAITGSGTQSTSVVGTYTAKGRN